jgi:hypothetical protein
MGVGRTESRLSPSSFPLRVNQNSFLLGSCLPHWNEVLPQSFRRNSTIRRRSIREEKRLIIREKKND